MKDTRKSWQTNLIAQGPPPRKVSDIEQFLRSRQLNLIDLMKHQRSNSQQPTPSHIDKPQTPQPFEKLKACDTPKSLEKTKAFDTPKSQEKMKAFDTPKSQEKKKPCDTPKSCEKPKVCETPTCFRQNLLEQCREEVKNRRSISTDKSHKHHRQETKTLSLRTDSLKQNYRQFRHQVIRLSSFGESSLDYVQEREEHDNVVEVSPSLIEDIMDLQLFKDQSKLLEKNSERQYQPQTTHKLKHRKTQPVFPHNNQSLECPTPILEQSVVQTQRIEKSINHDGQRKINQYVILEELGRGAFGKVKLAQAPEGLLFAIKIIDRKKVKRRLISMKVDAYSMLEREVAIMKKVSHQNIVKLYEVMESSEDDKLYLVLEYMDFGSLLSPNFFRKRAQTDIQILQDTNEAKVIGRAQAWQFFRQFCLGLDYLHSYAHIVHRDIKPENLLVNKKLEVKIADFGMSQIMDDDIIKTSQKAGTQAYLPPEVWQGSQVKGKALDIWASGITLFQMIFGSHPYYAAKAEQLSHNIINASIPFPPNETDKQLMNLISAMLDRNPETRLTIHQIMMHPWVTKDGREPLKNKFQQGDFHIGEEDLQHAITKLSVGMSFKTVWKLKQSLNKSRQRIKEREIADMMKQIDSD